MRLYWLKDRFAQNVFRVYWAPGKVSQANSHPKHHPASHVKKVGKYISMNQTRREAYKGVLKPWNRNPNPYGYTEPKTGRGIAYSKRVGRHASQLYLASQNYVLR